MAHLDLMQARARLGVFVAAAAIGVFDLGSYAFFKRESVDFVVARREREAPAVTLGAVVSWKGQAPGALFGWYAPGASGTFGPRRAAAFGARLPGRPGGDVRLVALVSTLVRGDRKLPRRVDVFVNGTQVTTWEFINDAPVERAAPVARTLVREDGFVRVELRLRDTASAWDAGDGRPALGLRLVEWRLEPAT